MGSHNSNAAMFEFVILLLVLSQFRSISGLSCPIPCHLQECPNEPQAHHCQSGQLAKDLCGCCDVCAMAEGEECGGPFGSSGTCANYLNCEKLLEDDFNEVGVCRAKVGSQCCDSLSVSGKYFENGNYAKTNEVYNNKPVYRHDGGAWCIFYGGFWKIENCDWLERGDDNSQGFAWSRVYAECPQHIGAQWRYFNFGGPGFSGLNGFTAQGPIDRSIDVICACEGGKSLCSLGSSQCIYNEWFCDGIRDCDDGSDEDCIFSIQE